MTTNQLVIRNEINKYHIELSAMYEGTTKEESIDSYCVNKLSGDSNKDTRQQWMMVLTGSKLPKSKCGITNLKIELTKLYENLKNN